MSFDKQHEVMQADRDAATACIRFLPMDALWAGAIQRGERDDHVLVQAFAKHRLAALEASSRQEERLREWPAEMTPDLRQILSMMCFEFIALSNVFRRAGFDIPKAAESEQAFFLHRLLGFWFEHGENWRVAAGADLVAVRAQAEANASPPHAKDAADV